MTVSRAGRRARFSAVVLAAIVAGSVAGCGTSIAAVDNAQAGTILISVTDQNGAGVPNAVVEIELAEGEETESTSGIAPTVGHLEVDEVPAGSHLVWATPPTGYTGGGQAQGVSVVVTNGGSVTAALTLTKTGP